MTASSSFPTTLPESVALFELASGHALQLLADVDQADLDRPTPCQGWNLRNLVLHLADSADTITNLMLTGRLDDSAPPRHHEPQPVKVASERILRLSDGLRTSTSATSGLDQVDQTQWAIAAARAGSLEFATHAWDVATACGLDRPLPPGPAGQIFFLSRSLISEDGRAPLFEPPVDVSSTASGTDRLVAYLGRSPQWRP